jgi:hypothetical protein
MAHPKSWPALALGRPGPDVEPGLERRQLRTELGGTALRTLASRDTMGRRLTACQLALSHPSVVPVALEVAARPLPLRADQRPLAAAPRRDAAEPIRETCRSGFGDLRPLLPGPDHSRSQFSDTSARRRP